MIWSHSYRWLTTLNSSKLLLSQPFPVKPPPVVNMAAPRRWTPLVAHPKLDPKMAVDLVSLAPARWQKMITQELAITEANSEELVQTSPLIIASWEVSHHVNPDLVMLWPPGMVNSDGVIAMAVPATDLVLCKLTDDITQRRVHGIPNNILNKQPTSWSIPSTVLQENTPPGNSNKRPRVVSLVTMLVAVTSKPMMVWTLVQLVTITHLMLSPVPTTTEILVFKSFSNRRLLYCRNKIFSSIIFICRKSIWVLSC